MQYAPIICFFIGYFGVLTALASQGRGNCNVCGTYNGLKRSPIIINGRRVVPNNRYPWVIGIKEPDTWIRECGGAIISEYWILTAAHCVAMNDTWNVGFLDNSMGKVAQIIIHPGYYGSMLKNDIALLKLQKPIKCGPSKNPICLPAPNVPPPIVGSKMGVNGWGSTAEGYGNKFKNQSSVLNEAELTFMHPENCSAHRKFNQELTYCVSGLGVEGICYGDSGGIGYTKIGNFYFATGVTSYGVSPDCRINFPAVFTKVSAYMDWITEVSGVKPSTGSG